jgi:hypothetical protein
MTMNKQTILSATIATILTTGLVASNLPSAFAMGGDIGSHATLKQSARSKGKDQKSKLAEQDLVKVSDDALLSMRDLHSARLAIFNGESDRAQTFVDAAKTRIGVAENDARKYALDIKAPKADDQYVPYNANLTVLDTYKPTKEKAKQIARANKHLNKGEQKKALETLKLSDIDVAISPSLVPVEFAKQQIMHASEYVEQGKYYEANLALKAVDDSVLFENFSVDNVPKTKSAKSSRDRKG